MVITARKFQRVSEADYLDAEDVSKERHELVDGVVYAMSGGTERHALIAGDLFSALNAQIPRPCRAYVSDMKLRVEHAEGADYYYPDGMVCCGPSDQTKVWRNDPVLLAEVLSPSTERTDRNEKLPAYRGIATVETILLVAQNEMRVDVYRRAGGFVSEVLGPDDLLEVPVLELSVPVRALYRRVDL